MAHDVFVSYTKNDKVVADSIVATLEKNDIRCFYAPRDIKPGEDWGKAISDAIKSCRVFLLVFSGSSNKSRRVLDELNLAISSEKMTLPFRIENLEPSDAMMLHLTSRHWLDAYDPSWEKHLNQLAGIVASNLDKPVIKSDYQLPDVPGKNRKLFYIGGGIVLLAVIIGALFAIFKKPAEPDASSTIAAAPEEEVFPTETTIPTEVPTEAPTFTPLPTHTEAPVVTISGGFQEFSTPDISVTLPEDWVTIDLDQEGMEAMMSILEDVDPEFAANISSMVSMEEMGDAGVFWAMNATGNATANLVVQEMPYNIGSALLCEVMPQTYQQMGVTVSESQCGLMINGLDAGRFLIEMDAGGVTMKQYQYVYINDTDMWILTIGADAPSWSGYQSTFETIAASFKMNQ